MNDKIKIYKDSEGTSKKNIFEKEKTVTALKIKDLEEQVRVLKEDVETLQKDRDK